MLIIFCWIKSNQYGKSKWIKTDHCDSFASKVNQNESESKIKWFAQVNQKSKKDFDSPRESKSFCDFWFTWANQKFANQNESIRYEPCSRLLFKLPYNNPKSLLTLNSLRWVNFGRCERRRYSSRMFEWSIEPEKRYRSKFSAHTITHNQLNVSIRC